MKLRKKLVSGLCMVMVAALLAACGGSPSSTAQPNNDEPASTGGQASELAGDAGSGSNTGDGKFTPSGKVDTDIEATLVFAAWDSTAIFRFESLQLEETFQQYYPNVNIEIEQSKDDSEYWQSMQIRASANQLPDVMYNKTFTLARYQDYLLDLTDDLADVIADNILAEGYAIDGKILGIPEISGGDYVFYWTDMFEEANVEIPLTWGEFVEAAEALQAYHGANDPDYSAIAIGAKDEWPTYPFVEFMPAMINNNGQNWNTMATQDAPFADGTDINIAYNKIFDLFTAGVCGKDPLGIGHDQAVGLFNQRKASIIVSGAWQLGGIRDGVDDLSALSTFYLPVRDDESETFRRLVQGDSFMGVTTHSANPELAKEFVRFCFSEAWYPTYINSIDDDSTMASFPKEMDVLFAAAAEKQPNIEVVMYDGGGDDFQAIQAEVRFDYKKLGAQMFAPNFDLDAEFARLNEAWAAARAELGIS